MNGISILIQSFLPIVPANKHPPDFLPSFYCMDKSQDSPLNWLIQARFVLSLLLNVVSCSYYCIIMNYELTAQAKNESEDDVADPIYEDLGTYAENRVYLRKKLNPRRGRRSSMMLSINKHCQG